jgi:hypothetical protein
MESLWQPIQQHESLKKGGKRRSSEIGMALSMVLTPLLRFPQ